MPNFKNVQELQNYIKTQAKIALKTQVAQQVKQLLEKYIHMDVYESFTPSYYERTFQLLNAVKIGEVIETGNVMSINIYITPEYLGHTTILGWKKEGLSPNDPVPVSSVAEWISSGETWGRNEAEFIEHTYQELKERLYHVYGFIGYLKAHGIIAK